MTPLQLIRLRDYPILRQLQLEEALLRADDRNWCILNEGSPPAIVMGISGKREELINSEKMLAQPIPIIRRFSGGGTVVVDHHTTFATFIFNSEAIQVSCCPEKIMRWSEGIYHPVIAHPEFRLRENDYVIGERKFGGNAQYLCKGRWLHHSTLLWDYDLHHMDYLLLPKKAPSYRQQRPHSEFLCKLREHLPSKEEWTARFLKTLQKNFHLQETPLEEAHPLLHKPHRKSTILLEGELAFDELLKELLVEKAPVLKRLAKK